MANKDFELGKVRACVKFK